MKNNPSNLETSFDLLMENIQVAIDMVNIAGAKAFQLNEYEKAREVLSKAELWTQIRDKISDLRQETRRLKSRLSIVPQEDLKIARQSRGRLTRGVRTQEEEYFVPILSALIDVGGKGLAADVLPKVEQKMKAVVTQVDYEPLPSNPSKTRWKNAASWARNTLIREKLMKDDSPRGIWEISEAGEKWLKRKTS